MLEEIFVEGNVVYLVFIGLAVIAFHLNKVWLRYPIMLASLAVIGFLQMGCPTPVRAMQFIFNKIDQLDTMIAFEAKLAIVLISALVYGKIFCGWVCPKGAIQDFLYQRKLRWTMPPKLDKALRKLKYALLLLVIVLPLAFHIKPFNADTSPFAVIFNLDGSNIAISLLALTLLCSLFVYRPFCRYICPTGALLGLVSYMNRMRFISQDCTFCQLASGKCEIGALQCPAKGGDAGISVDKGECMMCGECRGNCPAGVTIEVY